MFYAFRGFRPVADPSAFVHPQACVTGNVVIGRNVYIGPGAALRGDWGAIRIEDGCNIQENVTIHMFPDHTAHLMADAHVGHGAIIHGATIGRNCLVGMNAVVMDHAVLGDECIVGALSLIREGQIYAARSLVVGSPARRIRDVSDEMIAWKSQGTALYQALPADMRQHWQPCEPLPAPPTDTPGPDTLLETWHRIRQRP